MWPPWPALAVLHRPASFGRLQMDATSPRVASLQVGVGDRRDTWECITWSVPCSWFARSGPEGSL